LDLQAHREAVYRQLHRMKHAITAMEDYGRAFRKRSIAVKRITAFDARSPTTTRESSA
jgi:hypothetical protein